MGVDACMEFKLREGAEVPFLHLPEGVTVVPAKDWCASDATHEIENTWRWSSEDFPRGAWPLICSVLMQLLASRYVEKVWYYPDCTADPGEPITIDRLHEISEAYVEWDRAIERAEAAASR